MHGIIPILSVWFFCIGSSISFKSTGTVLRKSGVLVVTKIAAAWVTAVVAAMFLPEEGIMTGFFAGFSVLTLVAAMDMTNGGLYASLMGQYGTKEEAGAFVLMSVESGPLMTMAILGTTGMASFHPLAFLGTIIPFAVGLLIGNIDKELKAFFTQGVQLLIPFVGFSLGCGISLTVLADTGLAGVFLSLLVIVVTGVPLIFADKFFAGGNGTAGIAASSTAGAAVATPVLIAEMAPEFKDIAPMASALVATSTLLTSILVPIITAQYYKWVNGGKDAPSIAVGNELAEEAQEETIKPVAQEA